MFGRDKKINIYPLNPSNPVITTDQEYSDKRSKHPRKQGLLVWRKAKL